MIEPIIFDLIVSTTELSQIWLDASIMSLLFCISAFGSGFIINAVFGFFHNI